MAYTSAEARQELLDSLASAIDQLGLGLAALGAAYEQLDEHNADRLEAELFMPVQAAYGRAKSEHAQFADRYGFPRRPFEAASPGLPSTRVKGFIDSAVQAVTETDSTFAALQDSGLPAEVGDVELRSAISDARAARRRATTLSRARANARALASLSNGLSRRWLRACRWARLSALRPLASWRPSWPASRADVRAACAHG